ncbi:conjugal transfer protein TraG N-terminal domain-containing protein [Massilia sp. CT11-137]|uniref:conjugal transfer protein TraG N-terminal domain-containing protein n=1 Tax=Massilia sp. CT11-137 TaxID=3393901 RepID=UPI0039A56E92
MFPNQVIYTANGDLTTLYAILNAVAMICRENATIWGFALMAATWSLFSMTAVAGAGAAAGGVGPDLARRAFALIIPFCLAICLTSSSMKSTVTVESGLAGATTTVANVPVLISVVPATASLISKIVGDKLHTAMQSTGTDYDAISAKQQGFINPLKTLLTSRIAILRLGGIASEVNSLLGTCLNADAGVNYADIANHVLFAGNLPAAQAGPAPITVWTPLGAQRTSIGVLLAEAAQNTSAFVTDIKVGSNHIATCADAAAQVGQDIDTALNSDQFKRVVQGAVNAADQPNAAGDYTIDGIAAAYAAVRSADSITGGTGAQTDVELINLLFAELVRNDLECLRADGTNKSTCLAMAVQSNEIERNNIQAAANGFDALMYAGAFANQITAVIIGLGPVLVLFMMFSGTGAARNMKVAAHMIVWPLLIMNVGAELINGMMYISVSGFLRALAQGGVINQSNAVEVYKNFSLQIGTASHLMATLPILMSTIFALGQSAALVRLGESMGSGRKEDPKPADPPPAGNVPAATGSSVAMAGQASIGAPPFAPGTQFGGMRHDAAQGIASAQLKMQALSDGADNLAGWKDAFATGDFGKVGVSAATGNAVRTAFQAQGAADGNPLAQSRSLAHSVDSVMRGDGDARPDAAEARALHRSAGIQKQYADTLSTSASASDAAGEAVRKSAGLPALSARIGGADIAHQMRTNPAFRQFQLNEGHAFGNLPAARRYLEQARQDTGEGGEALARHRAALSMATDGQAAPEDRMRAHQYLLGTSSAMLAGQVAAPETRPAGGVAEAAPLIRPASSADDHARLLSTDPATANDAFAGYDIKAMLKAGELTASLGGQRGSVIASWNGDGEVMNDADPDGRVYADAYAYQNRDAAAHAPTPDITADDLTMSRVVIRGNRLPPAANGMHEAPRDPHAHGAASGHAERSRPNAPPTQRAKTAQGKTHRPKANEVRLNQHWDRAKHRLVDAAHAAGVDPGVMARIARFESQFRSDARPIAKDEEKNTVRQFDGVKAISSAYGYGQFTDDSWTDTLKRYGQKYGIADAENLDNRSAAAYRKNEELQAALLAEFTKANVERGRKLGGTNDDANVYALHNLGSGAGPTFLKALAKNPHAQVRTVLGQKVIAGNAALYKDGKITLQDAYNRMGAAMADGNRFADEARALYRAKYGN